MNTCIKTDLVSDFPTEFLPNVLRTFIFILGPGPPLFFSMNFSSRRRIAALRFFSLFAALFSTCPAVRAENNNYVRLSLGSRSRNVEPAAARQRPTSVEPAPAGRVGALRRR